MRGRRDVFSGQILGVGTTSGVRVVVGMWETSPFGTFADCMIAMPDGQRILLAPTQRIAEYVSRTYRFEEVRTAPVTLGATFDQIQVAGPGLHFSAQIGRRTALGWLLRSVPRRLSTRPVFATMTDPVARVVMSGVRTRGSAGNGRREYYAAHDVHAVTSCAGHFDGQDLGYLAAVDPEPEFGFSSTPRTPALTSVTTTVVVPPGR